MSEVTKEEMLSELEFMYEARIEEIGAEYNIHSEKDKEKISHLYFMSQEHTEKMYQAIRHLIEKFFEWQESLEEAAFVPYWWDEEIRKIAQEIRDFGKEEGGKSE